MGRKQQVEWAEAQKIVISKDLVAAAKQQLKFPAVVDRNRHLYEGPALYKAIYRYKYCNNMWQLWWWWQPVPGRPVRGEANAVLVVDLWQQVTLGLNIGHLVHKIICRSTFNLGQLQSTPFRIMQGLLSELQILCNS